MTDPVTNTAALAIIKAAEGLRLTAYQDITGKWTIGWGHTVDVYQGETITQAQADQLLAQDLQCFEAGVWSAVNHTASNNEFSAMVSLSYNIGLSGFNSSSVLLDHNKGDKKAAADAFLLWDKAHVDGELVVVPALKKRRALERTLYLTADQAPDHPNPPSIDQINEQIAMLASDLDKLKQMIAAFGAQPPLPFSQSDLDDISLKSWGTP